MNTKLNILFPIEIEKRELDYKLFLACMVAQKNNKIYIGQHDYLYGLSKNMYGGIYVGKNLFSIGSDGAWRSEKYFKLNNNRIKMLHLDEEGGIFWGGENLWRDWLKVRIDLNSIKSEDYICTWGSFQNDFYKSNTALNKEHVLTTGTPRFDLPTMKYRKFYEDEVNEINNKYGDFVLINTNVGFANNSLGLKDTFSPRWGYDVNDKQKQKLLISRWSYNAKTQAEYIKMVFELSVAYPDTHFVIRPHPGESTNIYDVVFANSNNVSIDRQGSVIPWLLACKILIHDGCTTAVEGYIGGANVINYQPFFQEESNYLIANSVGKQCNNLDDLLPIVNDVLNNGVAFDSHISDNQQALSLLHNLKKDRESNSFDMLTNIILECQDKMNGGTKSNFTNTYMNHVGENIFNSAKNVVRPLFREKYKSYLAFKSNFSGFNNQIISSKLKTIQEMLNKEINYKYVNKNLIVISV